MERSLIDKNHQFVTHNQTTKLKRKFLLKFTIWLGVQELFLINKIWRSICDMMIMITTRKSGVGQGWKVDLWHSRLALSLSDRWLISSSDFLLQICYCYWEFSFRLRPHLYPQLSTLKCLDLHLESTEPTAEGSILTILNISATLKTVSSSEEDSHNRAYNSLMHGFT